ncbi:hypothetical protein FCV25MIE_29516, partial [Fagus crenata]
VQHKLEAMEALHVDNHRGQHNHHIGTLRDEWVSELIDSDRGSWNLLVMHEVFEAACVSRIQQVPLSTLHSNDSPMWKANNLGVFTVKSAYHFKPTSSRDEGSSSNRTQYRQFWKALWKLKVPNKVKIHLWRACLNALPTRWALRHRRVLSDPICPICNGEDKTTTHALWTCLYARS